ncbi:MAG: DUF4111 domain-containing protein [Gemmatimonadota bacterium]
METERGQSLETCDRLVRAWIGDVQDAVRSALGSRLVGLYVHGSLAQGSYHPPKSDVDVLVVSAGSLPPDVRRDLGLTLAEVSGRRRPTVGGLELSVVTRDAAARPMYPVPYEVHYGDEHVAQILDSTFDWARQRVDPDLSAHFQSVRESGVALLGPPVHAVFGAVAPAHFEAAVLADLEWLLKAENILVSPFYAVLNCCRILMVRAGAWPGLVPSKEGAGQWALDHVPPAHRPTVDAALAAYRSPARPPAEERRTAGLQWDRDALLAFRDWMRGLGIDGPRPGGTSA